MRKICVVVGSRANYSSIKSVMREIKNRPGLELQLVVGASALLDRYGCAANLIERDGFTIDRRVFMLIEGETPATMAKSTGVGLIELATTFDNLKPDIVLTVGDRFETMATTLAAAYMNLPIAHTMGGEVSGTIDESIRHAVTKFAHIHFPASRDAEERIVKLGEDRDRVFMVGCPRIDLVAEILEQDGKKELDALFDRGVGDTFSLDEPFALVSQHPVTTEYGDGETQIMATLEAINELNLPALVLWPNADAGSDDIARGMRKWRERGLAKKMHFHKNLPISTYVHLMNKTACLVGNSSSGIREGAFIGTPVVNIGSRQNRRERGKNVLDVGYSKDEIKSAMAKQLDHGCYQTEPVYGDGRACERVADVLEKVSVDIQKVITY